MPPHEAGFPQDKKGRPPPPPPFEPPGGGAEVMSPAPAALSPFLSPRPPPPHRGALSVADGLSPSVGHLIHHPSTVDCRGSLDGQRAYRPRPQAGSVLARTNPAGTVMYREHPCRRPAGPGRRQDGPADIGRVYRLRPET